MLGEVTFSNANLCDASRVCILECRTFVMQVEVVFSNANLYDASRGCILECRPL